MIHVATIICLYIIKLSALLFEYPSYLGILLVITTKDLRFKLIIWIKEQSYQYCCFSCGTIFTVEFFMNEMMLSK